MLTSEVLDLAADLIERDGWWSGGTSGTGRDPHCAANAIVAVLRDAGCADDRAVPVVASLACYLGGAGCHAIFEWNDAPGRTQHEVIAVLRAASAIESAREQQDAAWATYAGVVTA